MKSLTSATVLLASAAVCLSALVKAPGSNFELLILHNNDMHARFEQTSQLSGACTMADREAGKCYGGFPRVAHVVKEARKAAQSGEGPPVLYLNAGDTYTGTAWFTIYKWRIAAEFINALQPDAILLGNNDIEKGSDELSSFINNIQTTILASNVILKSTMDSKNVQKFVIIDINGVKVGVVGYLTPDAGILDTGGDIEYIDEIIALTEEVTKLKALDVNIIIALGHSTHEKDLEIAREVDGLDFIIAGQKNKYYWNGSSAYNATQELTIAVIQQSGKTVPVIPSTSYSTHLGRVLTKFDDIGEIIHWVSDPIELSGITQDQEAVQIVKAHYVEITARGDEVLGDTAVVLDGDSCKTEECNLGNLITDAIIYRYATQFQGEVWTDAPVAIIHAGALAGSIAPANRPAPVTRRDLLSVLPVESSIVAVTMLGRVLNQVLEHSVSSRTPSDQLLQFSGIRATFDMTEEPGSRLVEAVVRCGSCSVPEYYPIDNWRPYKVLMPTALADGEFGYTMLVGLQRENLEYDEVTCTAEYIALRSPVYPEIAERVVIRSAASALTSSLLAVVFMALIQKNF